MSSEQGAWMREYERLADDAMRKTREHEYLRNKPEPAAPDSYVNMAAIGANAARTALDAHVRGLVEENERLRGALAAYVHACYEQGINLGPITGDAEAALTTPKDAP